MKITVWQRLDLVLRNLTPLLLTLVLLLASMVPHRAPDFAPIAPSLSVMAAYYWALHRPDLLPASAVFAIGLLEDALRDGPFGVNAVVLLLVFGVAATQRRFFHNKSFVVVWWGFLIVAAGAAAARWALTCLSWNMLIDPLPAVFAYAMTLALYPLAAWLFVLVQRSLPSAE